MVTTILLWIASIPIWAISLYSYQKLSLRLNRLSIRAKRKLYYDIGLLFAGTGGVGALMGITGTTSENETFIRASMALILVFFGVIMILLNIEE